jgi:Uma2 family endonuclease
MAQLRFPRSPRPPDVRYLRPPQPLHFPEEEEMPEGLSHLTVRILLWRILQSALGPEHTVGSDQFVYWDASDPKRCLSPDVFVRLHTPQTVFGSWKTWEDGGPPHLAVEIISPNEGDGVSWDEKLARYHAAGVLELVRFDPEATPGTRLRAWDRVHNDLVERRVEADRTPCLALGLSWTVCPVDAGNALEGTVVGLRLLDAEGHVLPTREESEVGAREAAEARVAELEEALRRRS